MNNLDNLSVEQFKKLTFSEKQKYLKHLFETDVQKISIDLLELALQDKDVGVRFWAKKIKGKLATSFKVQEDPHSLKQPIPEKQDDNIENIIIQNILNNLLISDLDTQEKLKILKNLHKLSPAHLKKGIFQILTAISDPVIIATTLTFIKKVPPNLIDEEEYQQLKSFLKHEDSRIRANCIENIGHLMLEHRDFQSILLMLNDPDNRVLGNVAPFVLTIDKEIIYKKLEEMLSSDKIWYNLSAAYALSLVADEDFLPLLQIAKEKKHPDIQKFVEKAFQKITENATSRPLMEEFVEAIDDPENMMFDAANITINKIKNYPSLENFTGSDKESLYFLIIDIFKEKQKHNRAFEFFQNLLKLHPENINYLLRFAAYLVETNNYPLANKIYLQALSLSPHNTFILKSLFHLELLLQNIDEAERYARKIIEINPQDWEIHLELAQLLFIKENYEEAIEKAQQLLNYSPALKPYALKLILLSTLKLNIYDIVENLLPQVLLESQNMDKEHKIKFLLELAQTLQEENAPHFSLQIYRFLIGEFPELSIKFTAIIKQLEEETKKKSATQAENFEATIIERKPATTNSQDEITQISSRRKKTTNLQFMEEELTHVLAPRYYDLKFINKGGMGFIYSALDNTLKRKVAIKVLSPELASSEEFVQRFKVEILTISRLNHPYIVKIYDFIEKNDLVFYIMEFVEGKTLKQQLEEMKKTPFVMFKKYALQILDAIGYAHENHIIHRDIKPHNIMINEEKNIKIMDFGLAKCEEIMVGLTKIGSIMGTAYYMAPEQILGENVSPGTDIYALGATFYEMLTGRPPFIEGDIKMQHLKVKPAPPSQLNPSLPKEIDSIILKCLEKDPKKRFPSCKEVIDSLKKL